MYDKINILNTSIVEIANRNSNTREVTLIVHKLNEENGNGLDFKKEYTEKYMNTLIDKPLVCSYYAVTDDLGTHEEIRNEQNEIVELRTIAIGTITDVWIGDIESGSALYCKGTVWSYKYPQIMSCIEKLFNEKNASASVEVEIYEYEENPTRQYRVAKDFNYLGLCLLGSAILPADNKAGVVDIFQKEVAMAVENDLKINALNEGGSEVEGKTTEVSFNYGKEMQVNFELSEMSLDAICNAVWNALNTEKDDEGYTIYKYYARDIYSTYLIACDYELGKFFKFNYTLSDGIATIDFESAVEVEQIWQEKTNSSLSVNEEEIKQVEQLQAEIEELNAKILEKENSISELNTQIETLQNEISTKDEALQLSNSESNEKIIKIGEVCEQLKLQIAELQPIKVEYEKVQAELQEKELMKNREELKQYALNSKLITEEDITSNEEIKNAIFEVNTAKVKEFIADKIVASAQLEINSKTDDVTIIVGKQEDLIPETILSKYGIG